MSRAMVTADSYLDPSESAEQSKAVWVVRTPFLSAELEEVIEIIARDRVFRAMLARFGRRLPAPAGAVEGDSTDAN